ncbi:MAG: carbonic anhydrase family protein [Burkholderiaceae bacterium]
MPVARFFAARLLAQAVFGLSAGALCPSVHASDAAPPKPARTSAEPKAEAADAKAAKEEAPRAPKRPGPQDPLDMLREKLATRLGATKPPDAASPNVLRVVSKPSASPETALTPAAAGHAHAAAPAARRTAAAEPRTASSHAGAEAGHSAHWSYEGRGGPESWGQMKPEFAKCSSGARQSPIDIRDGIKVSLDAVQFDYKPSAFRVIDNGHTVQVNVAAGNSIEVMGRRYELLQFHFHRPSEERIDGKQFDMVAHLVHKDLEGRLAVVAVLLERGSALPIVQSVWNNLPLEKGDEVAARLPLDMGALLPTERSYFTYMGSLTTPPCSEGVLWMVMKNPVQVSAEQIGIFSRLYPMNARPIQSASGRLIKESN